MKFFTKLWKNKGFEGSNNYAVTPVEVVKVVDTLSSLLNQGKIKVLKG